jgi:hydrogenase maturation protease
MNGARILVAGIGNIFLGDDAFGVEVARRMSQRALPDGVRVVDFGIRGFDLAYTLMDYDVAILVDTTAQGGEPGTVYVVEIDSGGDEEPDGAEAGPVQIETHGMNPMRVLETVRALGGQPKRILMVGCEPATFGDQEEGAFGLSAPVEAAVDVAIGVIESLVAKIAGESRAGVAA